MQAVATDVQLDAARQSRDCGEVLHSEAALIKYIETHKDFHGSVRDVQRISAWAFKKAVASSLGEVNWGLAAHS